MVLLSTNLTHEDNNEDNSIIGGIYEQGIIYRPVPKYNYYVWPPYNFSSSYAPDELYICLSQQKL